MALRSIITALLLGTIVSAQQGVLTNGNSRLPQCAQTCNSLIQAATACSPGATTATQAAWICFCQSAYLRGLRTSATGICDATCTNPTDLQQVSTWYNTNCGSDNGAQEHAAAGTGANAASSSRAGAPASSAAGGQATASSRPATSNGGIPSGGGVSVNASDPGDWWNNHYKWIIMLIVLAICLPALALIGVWLKRRHDRKRDQITGGFNAGITDRAAPMSNPHLNHSGAVSAVGIDGSGRDTPARTREAFMPYGYGYSRSESRVGSKQAVNEDWRSSVARGGTPLGEMEKEAGMGANETPAKKKSRKVLVRERGGEDEIEKSSGH